MRRVLEIDAQQEATARHRASNGFDAGLLLVTHRLGTLYKLSKEEDRFEIAGGDSLYGLYSHIFLPASELRLSERTTLLLGLGVGLGASQGSATVRRTGVTNGSFTYDYLIVPVDLALRAEAAFSRRWRARLHYGPASEVINQNGSGQTDTTTAFAWGESAGLTVAWQAAETWRAQTFVARRGPLLLWKQRELAGWVFGLGFSYMFAG